jgi:hypothetical protein
MDPHLQPASVLCEFLAWFACWLVSMSLQRRLCRRYPGLRTLCRMFFLWTLVVALLPGVWVLAFRTAHGPQALALFNHAFGLGVFAQTSVRSLLLVRWLAWPGVHYAAAGAAAPLGAERYVLASLLALSGVMRAPAGSPARGGRSEPG